MAAKRLRPVHAGDILLHDFMQPLKLSSYRVAEELGAAVVAVLRNECATPAEPADTVRLGNRQQKDRQEGWARHPALNTAGSEWSAYLL